MSSSPATLPSLLQFCPPSWESVRAEAILLVQLGLDGYIPAAILAPQGGALASDVLAELGAVRDVLGGLHRRHDAGREEIGLAVAGALVILCQRQHVDDLQREHHLARVAGGV